MFALQKTVCRNPFSHKIEQPQRFKRFAHQLHSLKITFESSTEVRMTHFNISVGSVNYTEIIMDIKR